MKIAIPVANDKLCLHFGHCDQFCIIDVDDDKNITNQDMVTPPPHEPGVLPKWLSEEMAVNVIIAGGMGQRAQQLFTQNNIEVVTGAETAAPEELAKAFLNGNLTTGDNACDH